MERAAHAKCEAVKFQKRTVDVVYSKEELERPRESPFGTTNGALRRALEFGADEYNAIDRVAREAGILWTANRGRPAIRSDLYEYSQTKSDSR